jgi:phasin family protein
MAKAQVKTGNPFLDGNFGEFMDFGKLAEQFKVPGVDSKALIESQRKNVEAVTAANKLAVEGFQAVVQRQAEIMRKVMEETTKVVSEMAKPGQPVEKFATQTALVKEAYELSLNSARELAEMSSKSNAEATEVLTHRFSAGLDELKGALAQANGAK